MVPQRILKIRYLRLAKNTFAIQHLLHYSMVYTFTHCCTTVLRWMHSSIIAFPKSYSTGNIFSFFSSEFFL
jgi:hypothetical protein